jgi:hypothetical protein
MVRSLLESHDIAAYLADEYTGAMAPHIAAGGGAGGVKVVVAGDDSDRARQLLADRGRGAEPIAAAGPARESAFRGALDRVLSWLSARRRR